MQVWTGGGVYLLEFSTVIMICISFYLLRMRCSVLLFRDATGLYWQDRWKPIIEALVNLIASIVLVKFIGLNGIFVGTIISTLIAPFWVEPRVLFKNYFKLSTWNYFKFYIRDVLVMVLAAAASYLSCCLIPDGGIMWLIVKALVCASVAGITLFILYLPTKEFRKLLNIGKNMISKVFKRKNIEE